MTESIQSIHDPAFRVDVLSRSDIEQIHAATLEVIETIGVKFPLPEALDLLEANGAEVDRNTSVARIPAPVIENALKSAPPAYTLAARDSERDLPLDGNHVFLGTDGCGVQVQDAFTGELHTSFKKDVADCARVADALDEIGFWWAMISAQDCPPESRGLHELEAAWNETTKHLQTESLLHPGEMQAAVEMAAAIAGSREELRRRPLLSIMQCSVSPLAHDPGSLEAGLIACRAGLPVGYMTMVSCASTGPATPAGSLVVGNAEVITALALIQMASPGTPVFYAAAQTAMDLRTGAYTGGGPEDFLFGAATNQLADFYKVPLSMGAFATGAKQPDWQAGVENSFSAFMACASGADMLLGAGLLHGSRILSYEQLVMDSEIFSMVQRMLQGIRLSPEDLALDEIRTVGPGGTFLPRKHTRAHMRELWLPELLDRRTYDEWVVKKDGAREWAGEKSREILTHHQAEPLEPNLAAELSQIIATFEKK